MTNLVHVRIKGWFSIQFSHAIMLTDSHCENWAEIGQKLGDDSRTTQHWYIPIVGYSYLSKGAMWQILQFIEEFELAICYNLIYICNIWLLNPI